MARHDLTKWIIHFVHRRDPENDPFAYCRDDDGEPMMPPDSFSYDGKPIYLTDIYEEEEYGLAPDDYAISVLKKILA